MDTLLEHHLKDKILTESDIGEEIDSFTFACHDTTAMGISWALYLIGLHEDVQMCIQEELDRIFGNDTEKPVAEENLKGHDVFGMRHKRVAEIISICSHYSGFETVEYANVEFDFKNVVSAAANEIGLSTG